MSIRIISCALVAFAAATFGFSHSAVRASSITEPVFQRSVAVGGAVVFSPKYEGSDEYDVTGIPLIFPQFGNTGIGERLSIYGLDDVRFNVLRPGSGFELGPLIGYKFDREEEDGDLLRGLGDIDGGVVVGGYAGYDFGPVSFDVAYAQKVSGDDEGYQIRFGINGELPVSDRLKLMARIGANYADDEYMQTYFGISATQSANSVAMLPIYEADAGFKDVYLQLSARLDVTDRITVMPRIKYSKLLGDAADSPLIETEDQLSGSLGITYRFDF